MFFQRKVQGEAKKGASLAKDCRRLRSKPPGLYFNSGRPQCGARDIPVRRFFYVFRAGWQR